LLELIPAFTTSFSFKEKAKGCCFKQRLLNSTNKKLYKVFRASSANNKIFDFLE
jgi:hypothetical protein